MLEQKQIVLGPGKEIEPQRNNWQLLGTVEYYVDFLGEINNARERIWLQTMAFEQCHFTNLLVRALIMASQRGVDVRFIRDAYSDYVTDNSFNHLIPYSKAEIAYKKLVLENSASLIEAMGEAGVATKKTNIPTHFDRNTPLPAFAGRDHRKLTIVDGKAYIGGVNMTELDAKRIDIMLKTDNSNVVLTLGDLFNQNFQDHTQDNRIVQCDANNSLLIDGGKPRHSVIMEKAYQIIDEEEEHIVLVAPYFPTGKFAKKLNTAVQKGVQVDFITTSRKNLMGFFPKLSQFVHSLGHRKRLFSIFFANGVVHAKGLVALGTQRAILGSHNFDELFVTLGTEELSILTAEPEVIDQLMAFLNRIKV